MAISSGDRLVIRRGASHGGGDIGVHQAEAVVATVGVRLGGEADAVQDWVHEASRGIAGEWAARAVAAVCSGGEPEDDDPAFGSPKPGTGLAQ